MLILIATTGGLLLCPLLTIPLCVLEAIPTLVPSRHGDSNWCGHPRGGGSQFKKKKKKAFIRSAHGQD